MNTDQMMHQLISDSLNITNNIKEIQNDRDKKSKAKIFLYDFCKDGYLFKMEEIDDILCKRLNKAKDENKFEYLFETYERVDKHLFAKRKDFAESIKVIKENIGKYFVSVLTYPSVY